MVPHSGPPPKRPIPINRAAYCQTLAEPNDLTLQSRANDCGPAAVHPRLSIVYDVDCFQHYFDLVANDGTLKDWGGRDVCVRGQDLSRATMPIAIVLFIAPQGRLPIHWSFIFSWGRHHHTTEVLLVSMQDLYACANLQKILCLLVSVSVRDHSSL